MKKRNLNTYISLVDTAIYWIKNKRYHKRRYKNVSEKTNTSYWERDQTHWNALTVEASLLKKLTRFCNYYCTHFYFVCTDTSYQNKFSVSDVIPTRIVVRRAKSYSALHATLMRRRQSSRQMPSGRRLVAGPTSSPSAVSWLAHGGNAT